MLLQSSYANVISRCFWHGSPANIKYKQVHCESEKSFMKIPKENHSKMKYTHRFVHINISCSIILKMHKFSSCDSSLILIHKDAN